MYAIQFTEFGDRHVLKVAKLPKPVPIRDELLIEVVAAGVNYVDVRERQGVYQRASTQVGGVTLPRTPGLQVSGVVRDVGPEGDRRFNGRRVMALLTGGGYAQFAISRPGMTICIPDSVDENAVATLPAQGLTAYLMMRASTVLKPGESTLIHGAGGGVGNLAVQIAKIFGAGMIVGTASTEEKRTLARAAGADVAMDYEDPDWPKLVMQHTAGRGVDVLLESIGGDVFEQNFECLAPFGRYIIFGSTRGAGAAFEPRRLMQKSQTITGIYLPVFYAVPGLVHDGLSFLVDQAATGGIRPHVSRILPLGEAAEAHRMLEDREVLGTVLLDPQS